MYQQRLAVQDPGSDQCSGKVSVKWKGDLKGGSLVDSGEVTVKAKGDIRLDIDASAAEGGEAEAG